MSESKKEQKRIIGRWTIGATLGKGGYSWVKRGQDIKTGKIVALKFMEKADVSWVKEQAKQVETEIEALKNIRHQNVMKLYAYNLNAQYPVATGPGAEDDTHGSTKRSDGQKFLDTILLVLEYAPGGELFDILYYTSALKESVARTYFKQIINGLEACHNANVVHRDLKPQNLRLDAKYNLKITDFGLSKIIQSDADAIMKTTYVGTRGYQAPELLLNQKYDLKCDVFSVGVILFILLAGYPPFEQASKADKWFKPLIKGNIEKFWKAHHKSQIANNAEAKDLLTRMLCPDPNKRIDMNGIKNHAWMKGETLKQKELIAEIRDRHRKAERKRRQDIRKMEDLAVSITPQRPIPGIEKAKLKLFPEGFAECVLGEAYTYCEPNQPWYNLFSLIEEAITGKGKGTAKFDFDTGILHCEMSVVKNAAAAAASAASGGDEQKESARLMQDTVKFDVEIFESRVWKDVYQEQDDAEEIVEANEHMIYLVRITRTEGDPLVFNKLKNNFMLTYCSGIIKGLPRWASKLEDKEQDGDEAAEKAAAEDTDQKEQESADLADDYSKLLAADVEWKQGNEVAAK